MIEAVLDASVILKWFSRVAEEQLEGARRLRASFEAGELLVVVPPLLFLEVLNVAARRWSWDLDGLLELVEQLGRLGFGIQEPSLAAIARWCGRGVTAYDACYLALAEERATQVISADKQMLAVGGRYARPLGRG